MKFWDGPAAVTDRLAAQCSLHDARCIMLVAPCWWHCGRVNDEPHPFCHCFSQKREGGVFVEGSGSQKTYHVPDTLMTFSGEVRITDGIATMAVVGRQRVCRSKRPSMFFGFQHRDGSINQHHDCAHCGRQLLERVRQKTGNRLRSKFAARHRRAFTVVELLVVIAIIGVMVALLLPAVQFAREAARQTSCRNNMRQIGIGLQSYHYSHRALPIGAIDARVLRLGDPAAKNIAWSAQLLPFIEQNAIYDQIDFGLPFDDPANREAAVAQIPTYRCPSAIPQQTELGEITYGGLFGERLIDTENDDGMFLFNRTLAFRDCTDGLSMTLCVGEDVIGPGGEWINGDNVFVQAFGINDQAAPLFDNEIRSQHPAGAMVLFLDGSVHLLTESLDRQILGGLITRGKKEIINTNAF